MLTDTEKDAFFNSLKIAVQTVDIGGNPVTFNVGGDELPILESKQMNDLPRNYVHVDWQNEGNPFERFVGVILRNVLTPVLDTTNEVTTPEEDFEVVKGTRTVRIDFIPSDVFMTSIQIFTNRPNGSTSGLIATVYDSDTDTQLVQRYVHNASLSDYDFTTLSLETRKTYPNVSYYVIIQEWAIGSNPIGIQIFKKFTGDYLFRLYTGNPDIERGLTETTDIVVTVVMTDKRPDTIPVSTSQTSGKKVAHDIIAALKNVANSTWDTLQPRTDLQGVGEIMDNTTQNAGEYLYTYSFDALVHYETSWIEQGIVLKKLDISLKLQ